MQHLHLSTWKMVVGPGHASTPRMWALPYSPLPSLNQLSLQATPTPQARAIAQILALSPHASPPVHHSRTFFLASPLPLPRLSPPPPPPPLQPPPATGRPQAQFLALPLFLSPHSSFRTDSSALAICRSVAGASAAQHCPMSLIALIARTHQKLLIVSRCAPAPSPFATGASVLSACCCSLAALSSLLCSFFLFYPSLSLLFSSLYLSNNSRHIYRYHRPSLTLIRPPLLRALSQLILLSSLDYPIFLARENILSWYTSYSSVLHYSKHTLYVDIFSSASPFQLETLGKKAST